MMIRNIYIGGVVNFFCLFLVLLSFVSCQTKPDTQEQNETAADDYSLTDCVYSKTDKAISSTYPFNEADYIKVVSYPSRLGGGSALIVDNKFIVKDIKESFRLNKKQVDTLFSVFYDYKMKKSGIGRALPACYSPKHSILFYKDKKPFAFYEVCFECGGNRQTKDVDFGEECSERASMLKDLFLSVGIRHGM